MKLIKHLIFWLIFILATVFCYHYPREWAVYETSELDIDLERSFAIMEWFFIYVMFTIVWGFVYLTESMDENTRH